jgi:serine/threonine protein phosphatase PrpC
MMFDVATISESGPRSLNEDVATFWSLTDSGVLALVADGLGGMGGGSNAAAIAVDVLRDKVATSEITEDALREAARVVHETILQAQLNRPELARMATTLTAVVCQPGKMIGVHCGDTRASVARGKGIVRLTADHSEGERLFRAGKLTKQEAAEYPRNNILESALGIHGEVRIDTFSFDLEAGDRVFLTTDGVHDRVFLREMRDVSERHSKALGFAAEMAELVVARTPRDNFSLVAVFTS